MNTIRRKLPIGIQSFEKLRTEHYLYVDKTALVYDLVSQSTPYFLSRPRRFGKSLLVSTFEAYFSGRKDLFKGLAIEELETEWKEYPIFHLDFSGEIYNNADALHIKLNSYLRQWEKMYGKGEEETLSSRFIDVIRRAYEETGRKVVVLIDEYDTPLLSTMHNKALANSYLQTLKGFYGVLKKADQYLRFVFLTGITKFGQVSVFSDLNQLNDISMKPQYATICGMTKEELLDNFTPELENLAAYNNMTFEETVDKMTKSYDGYHFAQSTPGLFNPFSILNVFDGNQFEYYWFQTGTPTYLVELLQENDYDLRLLMDGEEVGITEFTEYRADLRNPIPMFYQSGYLTIKNYDKDSRLYTLGFPNDEVRYGFLKFLIPYYARGVDYKADFLINEFSKALQNGHVDGFIEHLKAFFAGIPYELDNKHERHYQTIFYIVFKLMGQFVDAEVSSARGRADAVVKTKNHIYVFEFKLDGTAAEALQQIKEQGYAEQYAMDPRQTVIVGVGFSKKTRNVDEVIWE